MKSPEKVEQYLYGYCIGEHLEFRVSPALLVNTLTGVSIRLRATMARLLEYVLSHSEDRMIEDKRIMRDVFENFGLKCSKQRLWQAVNSLKTLLFKCGIYQNIIYRVNNSGFIVSDIQVSILILYPLSSVGMALPLQKSNG